MFAGIEQDLYQHFERGEFPARLGPSEVSAANETGGGRVRGPVTGILPNHGGESDARARGMYSVLSDGAFMAVELE